MAKFLIYLRAPCDPGASDVIEVDESAARTILDAEPDEFVRVGEGWINPAHVVSIEPAPWPRD